MSDRVDESAGDDLIKAGLLRHHRPDEDKFLLLHLHLNHHKSLLRLRPPHPDLNNHGFYHHLILGWVLRKKLDFTKCYWSQGVDLYLARPSSTRNLVSDLHPLHYYEKTDALIEPETIFEQLHYDSNLTSGLLYFPY